MFYEKALSLTLNLSNITLFEDIDSRSIYQNISDKRKTEIIDEANSYLNYSYPMLPATAFMQFLRNGNRIDFEDIYMDRRRKLNTFVLAELLEDNGKYIDDIINGIFCICEESAWQLPAHNSYFPHTAQSILPDPCHNTLDLFACETGAQLAVINFLLKGRLDKVSHFISQRIEAELEKRIIKPYLNWHFGWMGEKNSHASNWSIWCTQNILITVFFGNYTQAIKKNVLLKAAKTTDFFVNEYGQDGCCDEGAQYFRHAGLCLFNTMNIMNNISNNSFYFYNLPKIKNIAEFIMNVHAADKYYINFADCSPVAGRAGVREFLFGKAVKSENLMKFAAKDYKSSEDKILKDELNLFYRVQNILTSKEIENFDTSSEVKYSDIYYPSTGVFCARDNSLVLAVKAGHNADNHNHNDTGSFIIYKDGKPFLIDVGVETYTKKTFSSQRYELWAMQSQYHNLPTINSVMQKDGRQYHAEDVHTCFEKNFSSISMNIAKAYPLEAGIEFYKRTAVLNKNKNIIIEDSFSFFDKARNDIFISLMTYEKPIVFKDKISVENTGIIEFSDVSDIKTEEIPINDARLQIAWKHNIYRIKIVPKTNCFKLTIY